MRSWLSKLTFSRGGGAVAVLGCFSVIFQNCARYQPGHYMTPLASNTMRLPIVPSPVPDTNPSAEPYRVSFSAGGYDAQGRFLGGTELINIVPYQGKLYAGVGYWMDVPAFFPQTPDPPSGAQVIVLDSKASQWRQDVTFQQKDPITGAFLFVRPATMGVVEFHKDGSGHPLNPSVQMLVVGLDGPANGSVYTQKAPGVWEDSGYPASTPLRSMTVHLDPLTGIEKLYVGSGQGEVGTHPGAIYSAVYDSTAPGRLLWNRTPEFSGFVNRAMAMTVCQSQLFFSGKPSIFGQDAKTAAWSSVYDYPLTDSYNASKYVSGFRGLTCIADPTHAGSHSLLAAFEGHPGDIMRFDLHNGAVTTELHIADFLIAALGETGVDAKKDFLAAYNDMPLIHRSAGDVRLIGLDARSLNSSQRNSAWFLSRPESSASLRYQLGEIKPLAWKYQRSDSALWSVRTIAVSPFPEDRGKVLYIGGYDGHFKPDHNTAWIYRVGVDQAH